LLGNLMVANRPLATPPVLAIPVSLLLLRGMRGCENRPVRPDQSQGSLCYSQDAFKRAASRDKNLHIVGGAGHVDLYDRPEFVTEVVSKLAPFYKAKL
jgi:fermentation-respiration switch protein FrsA (DUF1100 family)